MELTYGPTRKGRLPPVVRIVTHLRRTASARELSDTVQACRCLAFGGNAPTAALTGGKTLMARAPGSDRLQCVDNLQH